MGLGGSLLVKTAAVSASSLPGRNPRKEPMQPTRQAPQRLCPPDRPGRRISGVVNSFMFTRVHVLDQLSKGFFLDAQNSPHDTF